MPAHLSSEYLPAIYDSGVPEPFVIKVDGGFDGFGALQGIRSNETHLSQTIIISYPLLRKNFEI